MYRYANIDQDLLQRKWYKELDFPHKVYIQWLFYQLDTLGMHSIDLDRFAFYTDNYITPADIKIEDFIDQCNKGKMRMHLVDNNEKIWFSPTIIFRGANKGGFRTFAASDRDVSILNQLAFREITRTWFIEELQRVDTKVFVNKATLQKLSFYSKANERSKKFAMDIAKTLGYKIAEIKHPDDKLKEQYGHICQYCGGLFESFDLEIDHIIPTSKGGPDHLYNKIPSCEECNQKKGNGNVILFIQKMGFEWQLGLKSKVEKLVKKGLLDWGSQYPFKKKNKKEKTYSFNQVRDYVLNNPNVKQSDYECVNPDAPIGERRWRRKEGGSL